MAFQDVSALEYLGRQFLSAYDAAPVIRAWFQGMNPALADRAPAVVIGERPDHVLQAARALAANG